MNSNPETDVSIPRSAHLAISAGCTALAGAASGLEVGLLEKSPDLGIYFAFYDLPVIAFVTFVAVNAWEAFNS
jgi:hypothetical protein